MIWKVIDTYTGYTAISSNDYYAALDLAYALNLDANNYQRFIVSAYTIEL